MNQYAKYRLYRLQRRHSGSSESFQDVVPQVYSVDGDGTEPLVMVGVATECGYTPGTEPTYRNVLVQGEWICDDCE